VSGDELIDQMNNLGLSFFFLLLGQKGMNSPIHQLDFSEGLSEERKNKVIFPKINSQACIEYQHDIPLHKIRLLDGAYYTFGIAKVVIASPKGVAISF
jgi:hypothetical protein